MFLNSDTDMAVLTFAPSAVRGHAAHAGRGDGDPEMTEALEGTHRLLVHGRVVPNLAGDIERMPELADKWKIAAWKTYTQASPDGQTGWWLDDEEHGARMIEMARKTGVRTICIHKGLPLPTPFMTSNNRLYGGCGDVGKAARQNPDINFIVYHSGYDLKNPDGEFVAGQARGRHRLARPVADRQRRQAEQQRLRGARHDVALRHARSRTRPRTPWASSSSTSAENNVLWGTDCIWYGSPQDQIQAFRTFQISKEYQEKFGYPEITPDLRAKVFGLNSLKPYGLELKDIQKTFLSDEMAGEKLVSAERADPTFLTYGPRTRREFLDLFRLGA